MWRGQERKRTEGEVFQRPTHVIDKTTAAHRAEVGSPKARPLHRWEGGLFSGGRRKSQMEVCSKIQGFLKSWAIYQSSGNRLDIKWPRAIVQSFSRPGDVSE